MIMSYFNFPDIDYANGSVLSSTYSVGNIFYEKNRHNLFLFQNVLNETRFRKGSIPSKLDYVFTSEENIISDMNYGAPLGNSNRVVLSWKVMVVRPDQAEQNDTKFSFWKADYNAISSKLNIVNWQMEFSSKRLRKCGQFLKISC